MWGEIHFGWIKYLNKYLLSHHLLLLLLCKFTSSLLLFMKCGYCLIPILCLTIYFPFPILCAVFLLHSHVAINYLLSIVSCCIPGDCGSPCLGGQNRKVNFGWAHNYRCESTLRRVSEQKAGSEWKKSRQTREGKLESEKLESEGEDLVP